jgi:hypothetical protein
MGANELERPFSSVESAIEFMHVLAETILEARKELDELERLAVSQGEERRARGVALALFKLKMLNAHVHKSRRALNDLRMLRRLILNERLTLENVISSVEAGA